MAGRGLSGATRSRSGRGRRSSRRGAPSGRRSRLLVPGSCRIGFARIEPIIRRTHVRNSRTEFPRNVAIFRWISRPISWKRSSASTLLRSRRPPEPDQEPHVVAVVLQQSTRRRPVARLGLDQQQLGVELGFAGATVILTRFHRNGPGPATPPDDSHQRRPDRAEKQHSLRDAGDARGPRENSPTRPRDSLSASYWLAAQPAWPAAAWLEPWQDGRSNGPR